MKIVVTGGTGFVGGHLSRRLLDAGHHVTVLGTRSVFDIADAPRFTYMRADTTEPGPWQDAVAAADQVFNLAGRNIFRRWSRRYKQQIFDSRVKTTQLISDAITPGAGTVLISTSAVGYYGSCGERELTEASPAGDDFLAKVGIAWEHAAQAAEAKNARVVLARFGIVLGIDDGALAKMLPAFRSFVGGPLGDGQQWFPWIHLDDIIRALTFLADDQNLDGPFNLCAPNPVRNKEMASALGRVIGRPAAMAVPAFMLRTMMGELAGVLLASQRALPDNLLRAGFHFNFPDIKTALEDLVQ